MADYWRSGSADGDISHEKGRRNEKKQAIIRVSPSVMVVSAAEIHTRVGHVQLSQDGRELAAKAPTTKAFMIIDLFS
jgi:hypothetical protein